MKISDLININSIDLNCSAKNKLDAIEKLVDLMANGGNVNNKEEYKTAILEREKQSTTGIGDEIAIPHAKTSAIKNAGISIMIVKDGVDYESLDGLPTKLFFMIGAPNNGADTHLQVLSKLSTLIITPNFKDNLLNASSKEEILEIIDKAEIEKFGNDEKALEKEENLSYDVLAVTACPTGIAHTFMAAEALENKAKEKGIKIKVETNGSGGIKNALTSTEIENAKCIIVAADKNVEMARFDGKKVIQTKVSEGIKNPEKLLDKAMNGDATIYKFNSSSLENDNEKNDETSLRKLYKHLMNGVSHMLPFVIGGGILIALAFLLDNFEINPSNFGSNTPLAAFFKSTGDIAFSFMLPVLAGYIAMSIGDRPALVVGFVGGALANAGGAGFLGALLAGFIGGYLILALKRILSILPSSLEGIKPVLLYPVIGLILISAIINILVNPSISSFNMYLNNLLLNMGKSKIILGAILGLMMSIDFGGPINKAAYVFGTAQIAEGNFDIMASVMIGGMVPPLAIAIATLLFKNKFTKRERESGITNIVMGLSFITEGAIPFAASDPLKVIPACAIGAAISGGLSMLFECTLRAPHGGIFVLPVVGNYLMYLVALIIGSLVGGVLLGLIKKPVNQ